jgi:hypothetical protein
MPQLATNIRKPQEDCPKWIACYYVDPRIQSTDADTDTGSWFIEVAPGDNHQHVQFFLYTPEPKRGKNRVHLDLLADDRDAEEARLVALGATVVARHDESDESWTVMRGPYGNEFCGN